MRRPAAMAMTVILAAAAGSFTAGCSSGPGGRSPYAAAGDTIRDPQRSRELHAEATRVLTKDPDRAERLLREALAADLYNGPAHNNLGILLLARGDLYQAAGEFQWARKLMPGHPDPRVNLAMTLERAGRTDEALNAYDAALATYDQYLPALQGKARLQIRTGRSDAMTLTALDEIALRGNPQWREWAALWRVKLEGPQ